MYNNFLAHDYHIDLAFQRRELFSNNKIFIITDSSYQAMYQHLFFNGNPLETNDKKYSNASGHKRIYSIYILHRYFNIYEVVIALMQFKLLDLKITYSPPLSCRKQSSPAECRPHESRILVHIFPQCLAHIQCPLNICL